MTTVTVIPFCT